MLIIWALLFLGVWMLAAQYVMSAEDTRAILEGIAQ